MIEHSYQDPLKPLPTFQNIIQSWPSSELRAVCRMQCKTWQSKAYRRVVMAGGAVWVDPNLEHRYDTYKRYTPEKRSSYMRARVEIEESIPDEVLIAMIEQGYDMFSFNQELEDLCSLLDVVRVFMFEVALVSVETCSGS
jgi:hypothetical protein